MSIKVFVGIPVFLSISTWPVISPEAIPETLPDKSNSTLSYNIDFTL